MSPRLPQNAADRARRAPERAPQSAGVWPIRQSRQNDIASRFQRESRPPTKSRPTRFTCSRTGPNLEKHTVAPRRVFLGPKLLARATCLRRALLALLRSAKGIEQCPSLRAKRKTYARTQFFSV